MSKIKGLSAENYRTMKFIMFCYNYERDMLHDAFKAAANAQKINEDYFWDKFQAYCNEMNGENAILHTLTVMATSSQDAFLDYIDTNYKGY